jgi:hypothetical protein
MRGLEADLWKIRTGSRGTPAAGLREGFSF